MRLNSFPPDLNIRYLSVIYRTVERFQESIAIVLDCLKRAPGHLNSRISLTLSYMELGREEEARAQARHVLRLNPDFLSGNPPYVTTHKDPQLVERYVALLRKAGLPD